MRAFKFEPHIAIEAILYIAARVQEPTFHRISKIFYFADRSHLEQYGRFICGDNYVAMRHGPVPSGIYDILKAGRGDGICDIDTSDAFVVVGKHTIRPVRAANVEVFSRSDIQCLDESIGHYGAMSFGQLTDLSHQGAWERTDDNDIIEIEDIVADLENPQELLEHLDDPYPG